MAAELQAGEAVGRVAKPFGAEGELQIRLFDAFPIDFTMSEPLFVVIDKLAVPLFCDRFDRRGMRGAVVRFSDFETEHRAAELVGALLYLTPPSDEPRRVHPRLDPDAEEFEPEDLVGLRACLDEHTEGVITDYLDGENPLFEVDVEGREVYVPVADDLIEEIDLKQGVIRFDLPEGLVDLNG